MELTPASFFVPSNSGSYFCNLRFLYYLGVSVTNLGVVHLGKGKILLASTETVTKQNYIHRLNTDNDNKKHWQDRISSRWCFATIL